jgi:hypothetical protein
MVTLTGNSHKLTRQVAKPSVVYLLSNHFKVYMTCPKESVTDPELLKHGIRAQGRLRGGYTPKDYQKLYPGKLSTCPKP